MPEFTTHTGLKLRAYKEEDGDLVVTLTGDVEKPLYTGKNFGEQMAVYNKTKKQYEEAAKE